MKTGSLKTKKELVCINEVNLGKCMCLLQSDKVTCDMMASDICFLIVLWTLYILREESTEGFGV